MPQFWVAQRSAERFSRFKLRKVFNGLVQNFRKVAVGDVTMRLQFYQGIFQYLAPEVVLVVGLRRILLVRAVRLRLPVHLDYRL